MAEKAHLQYLDVLKGVVIFLVVVGHAFHFGFQYYDSLLLQILKSIDMPIFLFLSGYLGAGVISFDRKSIAKYWAKKGRQLLLPLCTLPFIYALIFGIDLEHLLLDRMHGGYWFTFVLFEMFLLLYLVRRANSLVNKEGKPIVEVALALISLFFVLLIDTPWELAHKVSWEAMSWGKMNYLYYYFLFGYFAGRYKSLERVISDYPAQAISAVVFTFCTYQAMDHNPVLDGIPASFSGIVMAYATAKRLGGLDTKTNRFWAYLGKESRAIYLTHYFLLFSAPMVSKFLKSLKGAERIFLWEALSASVYAFVVIASTLLLVRLLKSNVYFDTLFYGKSLPRREGTKTD